MLPFTVSETEFTHDHRPHEPYWHRGAFYREGVRDLSQSLWRDRVRAALRYAGSRRARGLCQFAEHPARDHRATGREIPDHQLPRKEPQGRTAPRLLRGE